MHLMLTFYSPLVLEVEFIDNRTILELGIIQKHDETIL